MSNKDFEIEFLDPCTAVRRRYGMYIGSAANPNVLLREIIDNSLDEIYSGHGTTVYVSNCLPGGWNFVGDCGRGIPIAYSKDKPDTVQAYLSISELHSGSKFGKTKNISAGTNGVGSSCVNFLSTDYILMSKITEDNYNKSIPEVEELWNQNLRSKKDLFYMVRTQEGRKVFEGAVRLKDVNQELGLDLPQGMSTVVLFRPDPSIFESVEIEVPWKNLQYFMMIQDKFYKKKVDVIVNGESIRNTFKPYTFEFTKTIIPKDTSENDKVGIYITFDVDPELSKISEEGSVNGLATESGIHINWTKNLYKAAMKDFFKIKHDCILNGLRFKVIVLANEVMFSSQTKESLKSIAKVNQKDFIEVVKEFEKVFKNNSAYWNDVVSKLDYLADSMKKLGAEAKAQKMIDAATGVGKYRSKKDYVKGFVDATCPDSERMQAELFMCFPGDVKVHLLRKKDLFTENIEFRDLVRKMEEGSEYKAFTYRPNGVIVISNVIAAKEIKKTTELVDIVLYGLVGIKDEILTCTPDHKIMLVDGSYKEAKDLVHYDKLMGGRTVKRVDINIQDEPVPVYCLEVDDISHNFELTCGVVASNCEGLSAGQSLASGRPSTKYHAILPLRGKILNVSSKDADQALDSQTIYSIFSAIGLGIDSNNVLKDCQTREEAMEVLSKRSRYGKIIIGTDADSDGSAIFNELLHVFGKFARFMIEAGLVYRIISPIFKGVSKSLGVVKYYFPDDPIEPGTSFPADLDTKYHFERYKGLGSLTPETGEVEDVFFNPNTRRLIQITPEGLDYMMDLNENINARKQLLSDKGILTNPYGFTDL